MAKTIAPEHEGERYPFLIRVFGVLSIIAGVVQIVGMVLAVLILVALIRNGFDFSQFEMTGHASLTTLIVGAVLILVSIVLAVLFLMLGVRLLRRKHEKAALLCSIMIAFEAVDLVCRFMLGGFGTELIVPFVNMLILFALEAYSDPALREERLLQFRLREYEDRSAQIDGTLGRDATGRGYITLNFFNVFWVFVICSVLGLLLEIVWHVVVVDPGVYEDRAGLLYGPFSPIYGFGAVLMTVALNRRYKSNLLVIFLVAGFIGAAFEFFVSWFMETAFGIVAWDYTGTFLSIGGRTNFMFFCMWGALGLVWVRFLLPIMLKWVNKIPWNWRYGATAVATALMLVDGVLTLAAFDCWYQRVNVTMDYEHASAIVAFCNEHYDDEYMEKRFQSMTITPESASRA